MITVSVEEGFKPTTYSANIDIFNASKKKQNKELTFKDQPSVSNLHSSLRVNEKISSSL